MEYDMKMNIKMTEIMRIQYNTIQFRLIAQKTPQLTQTQLRITREKTVAYWKRQEDEYFLSYFMIAEKHKFH